MRGHSVYDDPEGFERIYRAIAGEYIIPEGIVAVAGFPAQFHRAERQRGPLPKTIVMRCPDCGHEVRLFRVPKGKQRHLKMSFATVQGVKFLPPGTAIRTCMAGCSS